MHDGEPTPQVLYGRERELRLLDNLIGSHQRPWRGEAGIGKSALLAKASMCAHARGLRTLTITGTQSRKITT